MRSVAFPPIGSLPALQHFEAAATLAVVCSFVDVGLVFVLYINHPEPRDEYRVPGRAGKGANYELFGEICCCIPSMPLAGNIGVDKESERAVADCDSDTRSEG
jgi:hypothetical protein